MSPFIRSLTLVTVIAAFTLGGSARAYEAYGVDALPFLSSSTTTAMLPLSATGGLVYFLVVKKDDSRGSARASRAAALYLQQNALALTEELSLGRGPAVNELAAAYGVAPDNLPHFGQMLRAHRAQLLELASVENLAPERAVGFFQAVTAGMQSHPALAADLQNLIRRGS